MTALRLLVAAVAIAVTAYLAALAGAVPSPSMPAPDPQGRACRVVWVCAVASTCTPELAYPVVVCP